jgi:O-Antigen ligase
MSDSQDAAAIPHSAQPLRRAYESLRGVWVGPRAEHVTRCLTLAGAALLFLEAAGTIQLVYTIRPAYLLLMVACVSGAPWVWRGWRSLPSSLRWAAFALLLAYTVSAVLGSNEVLVGQARAGHYRFVVYLVDLTLGAAVIGLVNGIWPRLRGTRPLLIALVIGAAFAATYGIYQWLAQRFGWPLHDLNNTQDSNGVTSGGFQGNGLFGWERVRGTFLEPHLFALYLTILLPICGALIPNERGWRRGFFVGVSALIGFAILLTSSASSFVVFVIGALTGLAIYATGRGQVGFAGLTGGLAFCSVVAGGLILVMPNSATSLTGRAESELRSTTAFRTDTWRQAIETWTQRPIIGYGPGQSSVRLASAANSQPGEPTAQPRVLRSAQGLWAASLIDAGLIGFAMWIVFLGLVLTGALESLLFHPDARRLLLCIAGITGVLQSEFSGDRLNLVVWIILGLLVALASSRPSKEDGEHGGGAAENATS